MEYDCEGRAVGDATRPRCKEEGRTRGVAVKAQALLHDVARARGRAGRRGEGAGPLRKSSDPGRKQADTLILGCAAALLLELPSLGAAAVYGGSPGRPPPESDPRHNPRRSIIARVTKGDGGPSAERGGWQPSSSARRKRAASGGGHTCAPQLGGENGFKSGPIGIAVRPPGVPKHGTHAACGTWDAARFQPRHASETRTVMRTMACSR